MQQTDNERPTFSREDLDLLNADAEASAALDAEDAQAAAAMRKAGLDDETISRIRGRSVEEMLPTQPTVSSIEKELDELMALRRTNKKEYYGDAVQKRHLDLIEAREKLKAGDARAASGDRGDLDAVEAELEQIAKVRRENKFGYFKNAKLLERERELLAEREKLSGKAASAEKVDRGEIGADLPEALREVWSKDPIGVEGNVAAVRSRTVLALGALEADEHDNLLESLDKELPHDERTKMVEHLANDHGNIWRPATDDQMAEFAETEWGAAVIERWGPKAAKLVGIAKRERDSYLGSLTERGKLEVERWYNRRSVRQRQAMVEILAARAIRRL
jgi:hypothetical protein